MGEPPVLTSARTGLAEPGGEDDALSAPSDRRGGGRATSVLRWLKGRADTSLGRLAFLWFRRYFEASRNSGAAATAYFTLSVIPCALVVVAFFHLAGGDENALAARIVDHMRLDATTADIVRQTFGSTSDNVVAATLTVVIGFLLWGLGIGQLYRDVYARAWRIEVGSASDQALFTIWFFVTSALVALLAVSAAQLQTSGYLVLVPVWLIASTVFWLWTPRFLLHRALPMRSLLPGALLGSFVIGGTVGTSPLWIGPTLTQNAKAFGSFGVVIALVGFVLIFITISMVCAVFSPVWFEWREGERELRRSEV